MSTPSNKSARSTSSKKSARPLKGAKGKEAPVDPAVAKREKAMAEFKFSNDEAKSLRADIRQMRLDADNETRLLNDFQQQTSKINEFYELSKQQRDDLKMELRNKLRQKQDLEEKQAYEIKIYKQKVKHLLHEQQINMTDLRYDNETKIQQIQDQQRADTHDFALETRALKQSVKLNEVEYLAHVRRMKLEQEQAIVAMRQEYERRGEEAKSHYEKKMKTLREDMDEKRRDEVTRIELKKNTHIADLMQKHKKKFDKIKKYYSDITHANLELIKNLKEEVGDMKRKENAVQKEVNEIKRINKKLSKPLQKNRKLVEDLKNDLLQYQKDKVLLSKLKDDLKSLEEKMKNQEWESEILEQKLDFIRGEHKLLSNNLETTIYSVQQKTGFKNLLLEKKLNAMTQDLEKTESALSEILSSTNLHPEIIGDIQYNLEDILILKNKQTIQLEDYLEELKRKYKMAIQSYEAKLQQYQIPVEELGFTATRRI